MANEIFLTLSIVESFTMWMIILVIIGALRKLAAGDFKTLASWISLVIAFFACTITATIFETQDLPTAILIRRHIFATLIALCSIKVALTFSKFVGKYGFPRPTTTQKRLEEWIKDY